MLLLLLLLFTVSFSCNNAKLTSPNFSNNACAHLYDYPIKAISSNCYISPNVTGLTPDIITLSNYNVETYNVTTPDGYILTLFRIPPGDSDTRKGKQPVFLQHGIGADSACWVHTGKRALAFNLADQGYDVWLGNQRGTQYSQGNTQYTSSDYQYWNYNLDDEAANDVGTCLKEIAQVTGLGGKIIYLGHSKGTTLAFMYTSLFPEEAASLINGIIAFSPVAYLGPSPFWIPIMRFGPAFIKLLADFKITSFSSGGGYIHEVLPEICSLIPYFCRWAFQVPFGKTTQFLPDDLLKFYSRFPGPLSLMDLSQYAQIENSGKFQKYDYGTKGNLAKYGQTEPPVYDLSKITLPVFMYYGTNDALINNKSVTKTFDQLGSTTKTVQTVYKNGTSNKYEFNHIDFVYSKNLIEFLYQELFSLMSTQLSM